MSEKQAGCCDVGNGKAVSEDTTQGMSEAMCKCMKRCRWCLFVPVTLGIIAFVLGYFLDAEAVRTLWLILSGVTVLLGLFGLTMKTLMSRK